MSEQKPPTKDGAAATGTGTGTGNTNNRGKRPPRGGVPSGSNNNNNGQRGGFKRPGGNNSGNRDSDSQASDASTKRRQGSTSRGGGGGRGGGPNSGGRRPSRPGSAAAPSPKVGANPPVPMPTGDDSPALSNLHKVITDLKSMPASSGQPAANQQQSQGPPPQQQQQQQQPQQQQAPTYAQTTQSNLTPTAAPFQPSFIPAEQVPPRHRKAQSMGPTPPGNPGANANSGYAMSGYAPYLDSMSEDAEVQNAEAPLPPMAHFSNRQPMGSFSAPRFSSLSSQGGGGGGGGGGGNNSDQDLSSDSRRPQLAPSFSFGAKRRTNSMSVGPPIGEEDAGFQFPQQNQPQQQQQQQQRDRQQDQQGQGQNYGPGAAQPHRRTGSEINGIMSQQIAIQNQIEALQQQQQELLQHQLASNQVSLFNKAY